MSALESFWSIPPIQDAIVPHLTRADFKNCIQVSTSFHHIFIPHLWESITPHHNRTLPRFFSSPAQLSHRHHVQSISLVLTKSHGAEAYFKQFGPLPNLKSFSYSVDLHARHLPHSLLYLPMVELHQSTLESLRMDRQHITPQFLQAFDRITARAKGRLKTVRLDLITFTCRDMAEIMQSGRHVLNLSIKSMYYPKSESDEEDDSEQDESDSDVSDQDDDSQDDEVGQGSVRLKGVLARVKKVPGVYEFEESRVQNLEFEPGYPQSDRLLIQFLKHCPKLIQLCCGSEFNDASLATVLASTLESRCFFLQELILSSTVELESLVALIRGCPALKRLEFCMLSQDKGIMRGIVGRHRTTLERLKVSGGAKIPIEDFELLARSCSHLKELQMNVGFGKADDLALETFSLLGFEETDTPWVCTGMERLCVTLNVAQGGEVQVDGFYQQLGRLEGLYELTLGTKDKNGGQRFSETFLASLIHLAGLKGLRYFNFHGTKEYPLRIESLEWMVNQWPRLQAVYCLHGGRVLRAEALGTMVREGRYSQAT